ncbi:MAG: hypothetical protein KKH68_09075 [Proteobacteria bacterium]|nr:hypothetical protein [Pseudomonadota bacterium]
MKSGLTHTNPTPEEPYDVEGIWVISRGKYTDFDLSRIYDGVQSKTVTEYDLSDLGRYLLDPNPIQVKKKLIGCEIYYSRPFYHLKETIRRVLPQKLQGLITPEQILPEVLLSDLATHQTPLKDRDLESHFDKIAERLKPYDAVIKRLSQLSKMEINKISDIIGTCRDIGGNLSYLKIQGSIDEKIGYICNFLLKDVGVVLEKAHISDGLFEMKGFDFASFDSKKSYRLIKFMSDKKPRACVINVDHKVEYWIENIRHIHYLQLFDQLIKMNPKLNKSLHLCTQGKAEPLKLFFNQDLEIDYSEANLPDVYRRVFEMYDIEPNKKDIVKRVLNHSQLGITFNYVPQTGSVDDRLFVNFSVMHNIRALDPIKDELPQVYSEINKRAALTEAGKYYLLDSFRGYKNE